MLTSLLVLLAAAALMGALLARWRLPTALGYLALGVLLGPHALGWLPDNEATRWLAELGVIFLLFIVGLEFSLPTLIAARRTVLGLGSAQVLGVGALAAAVGAWWGLDLRSAVLLGIALAMSSTALVLKQLRDRGELSARHGRVSVALLIFQDLITLPLLAVVPVLCAEGSVWSAVRALATAAVAFVGLAWLGRRLIRPIFYWVALQRSTELFTVTALLTVVAAAALAHELGLSAPLGAFLAGLVLGETAYRHQIESDLHPFHAVLLGLFFATIGMLLNPAELLAEWPAVLTVTLALVLAKSILISALLRFSGQELGVAVRTGVILGHGGEFGMLLVSIAMSEALLPAAATQVVLASIVLSMFLAPVMIQISGATARGLSQRYRSRNRELAERISAMAQDLSGHVVLCGFGRTGQNVADMLHRRQRDYVALDLDPARVHAAQAANVPVVFGDAARQPVLSAAGVERASALVITFDDPRAAERIVSLARALNPQLSIVVRTRDDSHFEPLKRAGATEVLPDGLEASLMLGAQLLALIGESDAAIGETIGTIRAEQYQSLRRFFHGAGDRPSDTAYVDERRVLRPVNEATTVAALRAAHPELDITGLIRGGIRTDAPTDDALVRPGDVIEVCGPVSALDHAEDELAPTLHASTTAFAGNDQRT